MVITSQQKKLLSRPTKLSKSEKNDLQRLEKNDWNPFVRVNPRVLEILHKGYKPKQPLEFEEALL